MGIDISKLTEVMKELAVRADADNNGIIEGSEISIFNNLVKEAVSEDDYKAIFGANFNDTAEKIETFSQQQNYALNSNEEKLNEKYVKSIVKNLVKKGTPFEDIINELKKYFQSPLYKKIMYEAEEVSELIVSLDEHSGYNHIDDDIQRTQEKVMSELKKMGKWDDFHKDLLNFMIKSIANSDRAAQEQIGKPEQSTNTQDINAAWRALAEAYADEKTFILSDYDPNDMNYVDADKYKTYIRRSVSDENKRNAICNLVDCYKKEYGDDWSLAYQQKIRELAGADSVLNSEELSAAKFQQ